MDERKDELLQAMAAVELVPAQVNNEIAVQPYEKIPLSRLSALGVGLEPIIAAVQQIVSHGQAASGIYKVTIPAGTHLAQFKNSTDFLGAALSNTNNATQAQAHMTPLLCNPTMLFMAATLAGIDRKLDALQKTHQEMMDFLTQKEKSELRGDLDFLAEVFRNYKYNWNDEKYKTANHIKTLDVRQRCSQRVDFYREQIKRHLGKRSLFHSDQEIQKQIEQILDEFGDYQTSLYLYGFSAFLEIILQENFVSDYLSSIVQKLDAMSFDYRELYSVAYTRLEEQAKDSLQTKARGSLSLITKAAGEAIAKIPVVSKSQLDESLISTGERLSTRENNQTQKALHRFVQYQSGLVQPFIEQIQRIDRLYNHPVVLLFDKDTLSICPDNPSNEEVITNV